MHEITHKNRALLAPLFAGWEETLIWSCLQGCMGRAWANHAEQPTAAMILTGDFFFYAGDAFDEAARSLVGYIPEGYSASAALMIPQDEAWEKLIEQVYTGRVTKHLRYAIKKDGDCFDRERLRSFRDNLPEGYSLRPIDALLYPLVMREGWSGDFCSQFTSCEDFLSRGKGYVAMYQGKPASGASSYTVYREGIEIEIDTKEEHRRKGLGLACAAALILDCLEHNLYPSWDAANLASVALAEKLGYRFSHEYRCCEVALK